MKHLSKLIATLFIITFYSGVIAQSKDSAAVIGPQHGSLVIVGGGAMTPEIWSKFVELAGGSSASIIIIPTAGEDSAINSGRSAVRDTLLKRGVKSVTILHTRDSKVANTASFVAPIKTATGIWFEGGRQWKLADAYLNTLAHKEFNALLERGGVIGGSSAGATIQGTYLFRGDTKGNTILEGDHIVGLDFIHHVAIDQHVLRRNRQYDLLAFIKKHPDLLGIGIDESTAIVVQKDNFQVIGNSYVGIYDINQIEGKLKNPSGDSGNQAPFYYLSKGQRFDLKTRSVIRPAGNGGARAD